MDILEVKELWGKIKSELSLTIPEHVFDMWISPLEAVDYENSTLVLISPHLMAIDILKKNWTSQIKDAVKKIAGENASYSLNYDGEYAQKYISEKKRTLTKIKAGQTEEDIKKEEVKKSLAQMQSEANLNLNLKFENFVVGENSSFAYNAAYSVANNPAKKFNPLFIYGASGLGKTHLLQAIGHHILFNTKLKVRYIRMEEYFNEWIKCFQYNELPNGKRKSVCNNVQMRRFHQKIQNVDVLLMDDIQFIESKMQTMEDFFSTFEALYTNNKQIVIASDRQPGDIPKLDNRLKTRFEMGLVVEITPPEYETRLEIVKEYAKQIEQQAPEEVFEYIAQNFKTNVRELKGAFNKVSAYSEFSNSKITMETAQKALKLEIKKHELTAQVVAEKVSQYCDVTVKDLKSSARNQKVSKARQIAVYICREVLNMSYESIGEYFDKKHTTVMYACTSITEKISNDEDIKQTVENITQSLKD